MDRLRRHRRVGLASRRKFAPAFGGFLTIGSRWCERQETDSAGERLRLLLECFMKQRHVANQEPLGTFAQGKINQGCVFPAYVEKIGDHAEDRAPWPWLGLLHQAKDFAHARSQPLVASLQSFEHVDAA